MKRTKKKKRKKKKEKQKEGNNVRVSNLREIIFLNYKLIKK